MAKRIYFNSFTIPGFSCILGIVVLIGIQIFLFSYLNNQLPENPQQLVMTKNIDMVSQYQYGDVITTLHKGDTVSYLGAQKGANRSEAGLLVQTRDGQRGLLTARDMGFPLLREGHEGSFEDKIIGIKKTDNEHSHYVEYRYKGDDGKESTIYFSNVRPILPDSLVEHQICIGEGSFLSKKKFESLYIGNTLSENDKYYQPAIEIRKTKTGWQAYYRNLHIVDTDDGTICKAIVNYDENQVATDYTLDKSRGNSAFFLRYVPLVRHIIDFTPFEKFIEGVFYLSPGYNHWSDFNDDPNSGRWDGMSLGEKVYGVCYIIGILIWVLFTVTLPMLLLRASLYIRHLYKPLNDRAVMILFSIITLLTTYIWSVLIVTWGYIWWLLPIIWVIAYLGYSYAVHDLNLKPHDRCLGCRRMYTQVLDETILLREFEEWHSESKLRSSNTSRWQTWTDVTTRWSDGSSTTHREDVRNHSRTVRTYDEYDVLYHVKEYEDHYHCACCGNKENVIWHDYKELRRVHKGTSTTVSES